VGSAHEAHFDHVPPSKKRPVLERGSKSSVVLLNASGGDKAKFVAVMFLVRGFSAVMRPAGIEERKEKEQLNGIGFKKAREDAKKAVRSVRWTTLGLRRRRRHQKKKRGKGRSLSKREMDYAKSSRKDCVTKSCC